LKALAVGDFHYNQEIQRTVLRLSLLLSEDLYLLFRTTVYTDFQAVAAPAKIDKLYKYKTVNNPIIIYFMHFMEYSRLPPTFESPGSG
jgi:hypothetical protein